MQNHDYLNGETVATLRQSAIIAYMPRCVISLPGEQLRQNRQHSLLGAAVNSSEMFDQSTPVNRANLIQHNRPYQD
jgi:hypothetical protein